MSGVARYDGFAEYYDEHLRGFTLGWTQTFTEAGLVLDRFEEPGDGLYPRVLAVAGYRP